MIERLTCDNTQDHENSPDILLLNNGFEKSDEVDTQIGIANLYMDNLSNC